MKLSELRARIGRARRGYVMSVDSMDLLTLIALAELAERAKSKVILTEHDWSIDGGIRSHDPVHCYRCDWLRAFDAASRGVTL